MIVASGESSKNLVAGLVLVALGSAVTYTSMGYTLGTLTRMGPGFVPAVLGAVLVILGCVMFAGVAIRSFAPAAAAPRTPAIAVPSVAPAGPLEPEWRGWACICLSVVAFAVLAEFTGLVPATFGCVFIAALGDRENRWHEAAALGLAMTVGAVLVFWWGLGVLLPLVKWDFG